MRIDLPLCSFKYCKYCLDGNCTAKEIHRERCDFLNSPAIDPKRGSIVWFERQNGNPLDGYDYDWGWKCSACDYEYPPEYDYDDPENQPKNNFCPNCGANMKQEAQHEL